MKKTVMLVDQDATVRSLFSLILENHGYKVLMANDAMEAFYILNDTDVDIVVTEYIMHKMDGFKLIRQMRKQKNNRHIPIIIATTESRNKARQEGERARANAWIVKPFRFDRLNELIESFLDNSL